MSEGVFLETKNAKRVMDRADKIVDIGGCLVVNGSPGIGKSAIFTELSEEWKKKHTVVDVMAGTSSDNRTGFYTKMLIREMNPDLRVPGAIELKFKLVRDCFLATQKKVVLMIDEAQNLSIRTIRGLKNLREQSKIYREGKITYRLAIVFFCKNYYNFLDSFISRDPGDRFIQEEMETLDERESVDIAKHVFGLQFDNIHTKKKFIELTKGYPSAIEKIYFSLEMIGVNGNIVSEDMLTKAYSKQLKDNLRRFGYTGQDIVEYLRNGDSVKVSVSEIDKALSGKDTKNADEIRKNVGNFLKERGIEV